ncbi:MAG: C40 family peptidase [Verrucomicrobia bacterium]|nr:C40 family peptidase [Verrucomicrobiota bacterium]
MISRLLLRHRLPVACFVLLGGASLLLPFFVLPASAKTSRRKPLPSDDETPAAATPGNPRRSQKKSSDDAPAGDGAAASPTPTPRAATSNAPAAVASLKPEELADFEKLPSPVRKLLAAALDLTSRNLTYTYGSADPAAGGMDCSGTIYYLLHGAGFDDVPRQANEQYLWVRQRATFYAVLSKANENVELRELRPGDLLFWTGTYKIDRDPPVTHTMIYLGRRKKDGKPLMFGASDGRSYDGQRCNGVSVFDFKLPATRVVGDTADASTTAAPDRAPNFAGYGPVPGMAELKEAEVRRAGSSDAPPSSSPRSPASKAARRERE